jgi:class 3 adenylate cyclase
LYIFSNGKSYLKELEAQWLVVDTVLRTFNSKVSGDSRIAEDMILFKGDIDKLPDIREKILALDIVGDESNEYFTELTSHLTDMTLKLTRSDFQLEFAVKILNQLVVNSVISRSVGFNAFANGQFRDLEEYSKLARTINMEATYMALLRPIAGKTIMDKYDTKLAPTQELYSNLTSYVLAHPYGNLTASSSPWYNMMTQRSTAAFDMVQYLTQLLTEESNDKLKRGAIAVSIIVFILSLVFVAAVVSAYIFSQAITGPWRRLIRIQEETIKKFVPRLLLKMLKCYRLSEITLGRSVERDLAVLFSDIRNFTQMSERMSPNQIFNYLNKYLSVVGPIIRKNSGYIDKFMGDGVLACFPTVQGAIQASIEMQEAINMMNNESTEFGELRVGTGIHCGVVRVGVIGENMRMEGTIIADAVNLSSRLETLTKAFRAKILTTQEAMKRLKTTKDIAYRPLGYVKVKGKKKFVKVYELLDTSEKYKLATTKQFREAVDYMLVHNYEKAQVILEGITQQYPEDVGARKVYDSCVSYLKLTQDHMKSLQVSEALQNQDIKEAFAVFMKDERSDENFQCWNMIATFKRCDSEQERIITTKKIYREFLSPEAKKLVNTNQTTNNVIKQAIHEYDDKLNYPSSNLFNDLQIELEVLMGDTFARFKRSNAFPKAFNKTLPPPLVHIMDEDVL